MVNGHVVTNKFDSMLKLLWPNLSWNLPGKAKNLTIITVPADIPAMELPHMPKTLSPEPTYSSTTHREQLELHTSLI
jgi:hypothetical protein